MAASKVGEWRCPGVEGVLAAEGVGEEAGRRLLGAVERRCGATSAVSLAILLESAASALGPQAPEVVDEYAVVRPLADAALTMAAQDLVHVAASLPFLHGAQGGVHRRLHGAVAHQVALHLLAAAGRPQIFKFVDFCCPIFISCFCNEPSHHCVLLCFESSTPTALLRGCYCVFCASSSMCIAHRLPCVCGVFCCSGVCTTLLLVIRFPLCDLLLRYGTAIAASPLQHLC
eukprot:TRINITY_DN1765_c0_g1_i1.p1 TRINITY_DN1765_c0_g1~~TRINITY_DN1765_c0_g1_i1.p1  ORF type:complete len:230 (+),score=34.34 TRINITY_DN1765_c0_g1_i1:353-1042(+)